MTHTTGRDDTTELWRQWDAAAGMPEVIEALASLHQRVGDDIARRGPTCWISGRCCDFDRFAGGGHRLYVTGLEIAWVVRQLPASARPPAIDLRGPCAFQKNGLCSIHTLRPLGCRVYFCQKSQQDWQQDLYERFLGELRRLHDERRLPYRYMEWRGGLSEAIACLA